jgi:Right handed beta helix region
MFNYNRNCKNKKFILLGILGFFIFAFATLSLEYFLFKSPIQDTAYGERKDTPSLVNPVMLSYYVSPTGSDGNLGSESEPFATIEKARDVIRSQNKQMTGNIVVYLKGGTYTLSDTLIFDERDSGDEKFGVIYKSYKNEKAVISGGKKISNWQALDGKPYWKATLKSKNFRQFYVNGNRRQRSRSNNAIPGIDFYGSKEGAGIIIDASAIPAISDPKSTQIHFSIDWQDFYLPVTNILSIDNENHKNLPLCQFFRYSCQVLGNVSSSFKEQKAIILAQPYFQEARDVATIDRKQRFNGNVRFYLENDMSLLDIPGEWFFDQNNSELFYYPLPGEKIDRVEAVIPSLFQLLRIEGVSPDKKVKNLHFEGLNFSYVGNWEKIDDEGLFGQQAQSIIRPKVLDGMIPPGILLKKAEKIVFLRNTIEHFGLVGIGISDGTNQVTIQGNIIRDIGDSAITVGRSGSEHYWKYDSSSEVTKDNLIQNNLIYKVAQEFQGAPGIQAYWSTRLTISHNELYDLPYTGIAVGWGWDYVPNPPVSMGNKIIHNRIENVMSVMRDGGGIYTLGLQTNSRISDNYISNSKNDFGGVYLDAGSASFTVEDNVISNVDCPLFVHLVKPGKLYGNKLKDNWVSGFCSPLSHIKQLFEDTEVSNTHLMIGNTLSKEAKKIIEQSGLEDIYKDLKKYRILFAQLHVAVLHHMRYEMAF